MEYTHEQRAIFEEGRTGDGNILIQALAGCAKTTTLLKLVEVVRQRSILFAAFGAGIAAEAERRMPKTPGRAVVVQTLHAIGRSIVLKHYPHLHVDKHATEDLVSAALQGRSASYDIRRAATRLVRCAKEALSPAAGGFGFIGERGKRAWVGWSFDTLLQLGLDQHLFSPKLAPAQIDRAVEIASAAIIASLDVAHRDAIDFCDMVWLPNVLELAPPSRYQAIMLDEVQDVSAPQIELLERLALPQTRWIVAGDSWQQIYGWRGSLGADVWSRFEGPRTRRFPLTITWRCSRAVVRLANELVPELRAQPDAEEGSVQECTLGELPLNLARGSADAVHTFILSRLNAPLLDCALFLWRAGVKFQLNAGQALLEPLFHLLDTLDLQDDGSFRASLTAWHTREAARADQANATSRREQIDEQRAMLLAALGYAPPVRLRQVLQAILRDNKSGIRLSTVHKVKGLEAERVFLLKQTFARQAARTADQPQAAPPQEELNIELVAITRARTHVIWVDTTRRAAPELLTLPVEKIAPDRLDEALALTERAMIAAAECGDAEKQARLGTRLDAIIRRQR